MPQATHAAYDLFYSGLVADPEAYTPTGGLGKPDIFSRLSPSPKWPKAWGAKKQEKMSIHFYRTISFS